MCGAVNLPADTHGRRLTMVGTVSKLRRVFRGEGRPLLFGLCRCSRRSPTMPAPTGGHFPSSQRRHNQDYEMKANHMPLPADILLIRDFDEKPASLMTLGWDAWMVSQIIHNNKLDCPLLLRLAECQYGADEDVLYAPSHLEIVKLEIETVSQYLASKESAEILGENMAAKVSVGTVRALLNKLMSIVEKGIAEKKSLFVLFD